MWFISYILFPASLLSSEVKTCALIFWVILTCSDREFVEYVFVILQLPVLIHVLSTLKMLQEQQHKQTPAHFLYLVVFL